MNWLNSIDNILERGFTRGQASDDNDDEDSSVYSHDTDNQIDENSTWSDDGDSSPRVALSRDQSSSMEEEGGKTPQTPSTPTQPLQRTIQQQTMKQRPGATKPSRPGNIRLQFKRQTSSSSSSSEDESDNDQGEPLLDNERQLSDTLDTNKGENEMLTQSAGPTGEERKQKPGPISLSDHDSCIASIKASRSNYSMEGHSVSEPQDQQSDTSSTVGTPNLSPLSQATGASPSNASAEVEDKDEVVSATPDRSSDNKITPANSHCQETEDSAEPLISTSPSSLSRLLEKDHDNQEVSELPTPPVLTRPSLEQEESYMQQGSSPIPTGMLPLPTQRESKKTKETPAPQSTTKSTNNERDNRSPIQSKGNSPINKFSPSHLPLTPRNMATMAQQATLKKLQMEREAQARFVTMQREIEEEQRTKAVNEDTARAKIANATKEAAYHQVQEKSSQALPTNDGTPQKFCTEDENREQPPDTNNTENLCLAYADKEPIPANSSPLKPKGLASQKQSHADHKPSCSQMYSSPVRSKDLSQPDSTLETLMEKTPVIRNTQVTTKSEIDAIKLVSAPVLDPVASNPTSQLVNKTNIETEDLPSDPAIGSLDQKEIPSSAASVSSGWSWSESKGTAVASDDGSDTMDVTDDDRANNLSQATVENATYSTNGDKAYNSNGNGKKDAQVRTSSDDFEDEECKAMASELEELRALIDAVSTGDGADKLPPTPNEAEKENSCPTEDTSEEGALETIFFNDESEEDELDDETDPTWIGTSSRDTLPVVNTSTDLQQSAVNMDISEVSLGVDEIDDNDKKEEDPLKGEAHNSEEFEVDRRVTSTWENDPAYEKLQPVNCYGAFHIRVLRAQRLPCPFGSSVRANVSLLPWRGRAKTDRKTAFVLDDESASFDHGVCVQWNDLPEESSTLSLVHAYTSEATPMPTIQVELKLCPMKMLEFTMCSLKLPCDILMKCPGVWKKQWFLMEVPDARTTKDGLRFGEDDIPMVEIEAIFAPDNQQNLGSSFVELGSTINVAADDEGDISQALSFDDRDNDTASIVSEGMKSRSEISVKFDDSSVRQGKAHLLRYKKFWKPATCGQCSASLLSWKMKSFRCEACGIDCCGDCRQHLDVQLPCGSAKSREIVRKAIQNKFTLTNFIEAVAPVDEDYEKKRELEKSPLDGDVSTTGTKTEGGTVSKGEKGRIGVLKLNIARACVFSNAMPAVADTEDVINFNGDLRPGDYYVRVCRTGSEVTSRTGTMPSNGVLKFVEGSSEMRLDVEHYGVAFFIEVVDAITDKTVGTSVLTTQGLLQQQRDSMIEEGKMPILYFGRPPSFKGKRRMTLELRAGVKSGATGDFFVSSDTDSNGDKAKISGWVELNVGLEEDIKRLFGPEPYECPAPPPAPFNLTTLFLHVSRIIDFIKDIAELIKLYQYAVSWRNPLLTGVTFVLFLAFAIKFDSEYVGCLFPFFGLLCMLGSAFSRRNAKNRFVQEEADEWKQAEKEIEVNYTLHRPVGKINVAVSKGSNIRSRDLGLAGSVGCRVFLDPLRFASDKQKERLAGLDKSANSIHEIAVTDSKFTTNPVWDKLNESQEAKRLKSVLPRNGHFFESEEDVSSHTTCEFPVLQPFRKVNDDEEDDDNPRHVNAALEPWKSSTAGIVFQIRFLDILNMLPGSDHKFGEVAIPLADLVQERQLSGWYQVLEVGTKEFARVDEKSIKGEAEDGSIGHEVPKIFVSLQWSPPEDKLQSSEARETAREASFVIQEELLRWQVVNRDKDKLLLERTMEKFKTARGQAEALNKLQIILEKIANTLEAVRNLMNFTDPHKSSLVLAIVALLWIVLSLLPTRLIFLVAGLAQFGITAKARLGKLTDENNESENDDVTVASNLEDEDDAGDRVVIWLKNAFRSLPTDEDLRKAYFWEGRRIGAKTREGYATEKRMARLKGLWRAQWHGMIKIRGDSTDKNNKSGRKWETIFAVVQGRRFLWWKSIHDFDGGNPPQGRIFLAGHAGLSGLSPLEMREIDPKHVPLVTGIFGQGLQQQQRVTLLLPNNDMKEGLENAVIEASLKED